MRIGGLLDNETERVLFLMALFFRGPASERQLQWIRTTWQTVKVCSGLASKEEQLVGFEITKTQYSGKIGETVIGQGSGSFKVGGETCYPFHDFEGGMPNPPRVGMEIWDMEPDEWPEWCVEPFKGVVGDPVAWAKKCVDEYGADFIVVRLVSTDPNDKDADPKTAAETVKKVAEAVDVPVIAWGTANPDKDAAVLAAVAETCQGKSLILGPVEEKNHKQVGAQALAYKHGISANAPIDVNLSKQLNILLGNLGVSLENVVIDPTTGALGYGMEYCYSVMERIRMAALTQDDDKLMVPMINNIGTEIWKVKEAKETLEAAPELGDPLSRAVLMEAVTAVSVLLAGSDLLILRHPDTVNLIKGYIDLMMNGGGSKADALAPSDLVAPSAEAVPREEAKVEAVKAAAKPAPKPEAKPAPKPEAKPAAAPAPKPEPKPEPAPPAAKEKAAEVKAEEEALAAAQAKAAAEAQAKEEAEARAQAEAEAKAKAEEEAKAKAEAEARAQEEAQAAARAAAKAKAEEELIDLRAKRRAEREKHWREEEEEEVGHSPSKVQIGMVDKLVVQLGRVHKRAFGIELEDELGSKAEAAAPAPKAKSKPKAAAKPKAKAKSTAKAKPKAKAKSKAKK